MQNAGDQSPASGKTPGQRVFSPRKASGCRALQAARPLQCEVTSSTGRLQSRLLFDTRMLPRLAIVILFALTGCAHPVTRRALRAPNPNGCYAIVYEQASFGGAGDVLNGPARHSTLERLPGTNQTNWHRRVRSLRVGPGAMVTAYVRTAFQGQRQQFAPATEHLRLEPAFSGRIESLEVACVERPGLRP